MQAVQNLMREHAENLLESSDGVQREFFVSFINTPQLFRLRQLKALDLGKLVSFAGKPEIPNFSLLAAAQTVRFEHICVARQLYEDLMYCVESLSHFGLKVHLKIIPRPKSHNPMFSLIKMNSSLQFCDLSMHV